MQATVFKGLFLLSAGLLSASGCGGGAGDEATGTGGAKGSTSSGGENAGEPNNSFETATPITYGDLISADLGLDDVDYYRFEGKAGQAVSITTLAQGTTLPASTTIDTVITLYDNTKTQLAENNDAVPRTSNDARLFTLLPADGKYTIKVSECWSWSKDPNNTCSQPKKKDHTAYKLGLTWLDPKLPGNVEEKEKGNAAALATPVTYRPLKGGGYDLSVLYGTYESAMDVDVFAFNIPVDAKTPTAGKRTTASHFVLQSSPSGDGSPTPVGRVYITTAAAPQTVIAAIDNLNYKGTTARIAPPVTFGKDYLLWVEHPAAAATSGKAFYFVLHGGNLSNPVEQHDAANDALEGADVSVIDPSYGSAFFEGDILKGGADVDHFIVDVKAQAGHMVNVFCSAARLGSGLRGLTVEILHGDGAQKGKRIDGASASEKPDQDAISSTVPVPSGEANIFFRVTAAAQATDVTSAFYRCVAHFQ
jgi:Bacterial pre-peptidase C-terminal domain